MSEFDKWFKSEMPNSHKKVGKEKIETVIYSCAESAWSYKQAKIDDLQGRIDEAIDYIAESGVVNLTSEIALNHILKGNKDD